MQKLFFVILTLSITAGCDQISPFIDDEQLETRLDLDNDGIPRPDDCNDSDPKIGIIYWYKDLDSDGIGGNEKVVACLKPSGTTDVSGDCDDTKKNVFPKADEICDGVDNDCNGETDEGLDKTWYQDSDKDLFGNKSQQKTDCKKPEGYVEDNTDCDDTKSSIKPGALELCDSIDQNCNGQTDEGLDQTWYEDSDKDTFGNPEVSKINCEKPDGYVADKTDCNDKSSSVKPGANESCNQIDDDCNGETDEGLDVVWYEDFDKDTFGNPNVSLTNCLKPEGYVADKTDCNDKLSSVKPGANESCNQIDDDCNGKTDEGLSDAWYKDSDNDTYGDAKSASYSCNKKDGYVNNKLDCNDNNENVNPGKTEICDDNIDQNCNGIIDDAVGATLWYPDSDKDGFGSPVNQKYACKKPEGFADNYKDCDDNNFKVNPSAKEACKDLIDNDCNGITDTDAIEVSWYKDFDKDNYGDLSSAVTACSPPDGYVDNSEDCNDSAVEISPSASETCNNGIDDNCDKSVNQCLLKGTYTASSSQTIVVSNTSKLLKNTMIFADVNNDQQSDLVIGVENDSSTYSLSGAVYVFFGPITKKTLSFNDADIKWTGEEAGDKAGLSLAKGDINGDGKDDLLIGAPEHKKNGAVYLILGSKSPKSGSLSLSSTKWIGEIQFDEAGSAVSSGDVNGDGKDDVIIGARDYISNNTHPGMVYLVMGSENPIGGSLTNAKAKWLGFHSMEHVGEKLNASGDINGDGMNDIVINTQNILGIKEDTGGLYVILGSKNLTSGVLKDTAIKWIGESSYDLAGSVFDVGDVNDDDKDDIIVGAQYQNKNGAFYVILGSANPAGGNLSKATAKWIGEMPADRAGSCLSVGDINGDNRQDIVVGALGHDGLEQNIGAAYLVLGSVNPISGNLANATAKWTGKLYNSQFGKECLIGSDLNGDKIPDIVISSPYSNKNNDDELYIVINIIHGLNF